MACTPPRSNGELSSLLHYCSAGLLAAVALAWGMKRSWPDHFLRSRTPFAPADVHDIPLAGEWQLQPQLCEAHPTSLACTPSGHAWVDASRPYVDGERACSMLHSRRVSNVLFLGDSFVRHAYEAFLLVLSANYESGALDEEGQLRSDCRGDGQFEEKVCRAHVRHRSRECNDTVSVTLRYGPWPLLENEDEAYDVIFWGAGAHPVPPDIDYSTRCGIPSLDVFGMTSKLVTSLPDDARNMTWDGAHWSRSVNLLKAQLALYAIFNITA